MDCRHRIPGSPRCGRGAHHPDRPPGWNDPARADILRPAFPCCIQYREAWLPLPGGSCPCSAGAPAQPGSASEPVSAHLPIPGDRDTAVPRRISRRTRHGAVWQIDRPEPGLAISPPPAADRHYRDTPGIY